MIQIGGKAATIDTPIEHLMTCHRRIEERLDTLVNAADHIEHDPAASNVAIEKSLHFLDTNGVLHTRDEEESLFPRLRPRLSGSELEFVDSLEEQHHEAEQIYSDLKQMAPSLSSESLPRYRECAERLRALYRRHIQAEDEILTALARRDLPAGEIEAISREMKQRRKLA